MKKSNLRCKGLESSFCIGFSLPNGFFFFLFQNGGLLCGNFIALPIFPQNCFCSPAPKNRKNNKFGRFLTPPFPTSLNWKHLEKKT